MVDIDLKILLVQLATFLLGLVLLWKIFYKRLTKIMETRSEKIKSDIENAEKFKTEMNELKQKYEKELGSIEVKLQELTRQAIKEGQIIKEEIISTAREEAKQTILQTKEKLGMEKEKTLKEIKDEIINISMSAAEKILKQNLNKETNKKLVEDFITQIETERNTGSKTEKNTGAEKK
ncbi:MAG: F0F1 ATP synthase subunit B [Candidatus Firestonebacteria bacterium]